MSKAEDRRRHTNAVGKRDKDGVLCTPNGHKGRSQKGCFGYNPHKTTDTVKEN